MSFRVHYESKILQLRYFAKKCFNSVFASTATMAVFDQIIANFFKPTDSSWSQDYFYKVA
jgi:hypothetical protein